MTYPKVTIDWRDAYSIDEWTDMKEIESQPDFAGCTTIVFLVHETPGAYFVAGSLGAGDASCIMVIDKHSVTNVNFEQKPN